MSRALLNRNFEMPTDGWYHLAPLGEFQHEHGLQVIDQAAVDAILQDFRNREQAEGERFPGVLVDYDHFSLDTGHPSRAAGWITNMESRPDGIWGRIRWTSSGEDAVKSGEYRFISPVWRLGKCQKLGNKRLRPLEISRAAVTNDPNLIGLTPLSNRQNLTDGPSVSGEDPTKDPREEEYMKPICNALGLAADADENAVVNAINKLKTDKDAAENRATQAETRATEAEKQVLEAQVEQDLTEFSDVIENRDDVKAALMANRGETIKILKSVKANRGAADPAKGDQVPNRKAAKVPDGSKSSDDSAEKAKAAAIRNRAQDIQKREGVTWPQAFDRAANELS